ncbi:MAG TPA: group III truncated hemoglobin [Bryobacteraceae bacterium]|nr:group III truncated hemoglobin [Bryobacteraceae bacterium]
MYNAVDENSIADMLDTFYGAIREDLLLGPIFAAAMGEDWGPHLAKMKAFWSTVLLASRTYKGNPMMAHLQLPRLTETHFERWLELWRETSARLCTKAPAEMFVQKAEGIGARLLGAITQYHDHFAAQTQQ